MPDEVGRAELLIPLATLRLVGTIRLTIWLPPKIEWIKGRMITDWRTALYTEIGSNPLLPADYFTINYGKLGGLTFKFVNELR